MFSGIILSAEEGDVIDVFEDVLSRRRLMNDDLISYLKISGDDIDTLFSSVPGLEKVDDGNQGTFRVTDIDQIMEAFIPKSLREVYKIRRAYFQKNQSD